MRNPTSSSRTRPRLVRQSDQKSRSAFTLIELVVVIMIIAILASLLMVGVQGAVARARVAAVTVDIKNLEQGIKEFQAKFSVSDPPPSGLILFESADDWADFSAGKNTQQNAALIRRLWPNFLKSNGKPDLNGDNVVNVSDNQDINGNGTKTDVIYLNGAECLVFFLGGIMEKNGSEYIPHGFSTNPLNPFWRAEDRNGNGTLDMGEDQNGNGTLDGWGTRIGPFAEFRTSRLVDDTTGGTDDMPIYLDAFPGSRAPYQYFSAYGGRGYRIFGVDNPNPMTAPTMATADDEVIWMDASTLTLFSVYLQKDSQSGSNLPRGTPWAEKSFQIISAGQDGEWGRGGFLSNDGIEVSATGAAPYRNYAVRSPEKDNITSFKGGTLN